MKKENKKIKEVLSLEKQYETIIKDLFKKYHDECLKEAIEDLDGVSGQNIQMVIDLALEKMRLKTYSDLGLKPCFSISGILEF